MSIEDSKLKNILEAALMAVGKPMSLEQLMTLFADEERPSANRLRAALAALQADCEGRGFELNEVASGFRYQARQDYAEWLSRLWEERAPKYSRAYLETLALIAYRQPVTRAEIEEVRGVSVSSNIVKTMLEREWIRVVGHRDVPGRPSLYATTKQFLDYFNMKSLDELPSLAEIRDLDDLSPELDLSDPDYDDNENKSTGKQARAENDEAEQPQSDVETGDIVDDEIENSETLDDFSQAKSDASAEKQDEAHDDEQDDEHWEVEAAGEETHAENDWSEDTDSDANWTDTQDEQGEFSEEFVDDAHANDEFSIKDNSDEFSDTPLDDSEPVDTSFDGSDDDWSANEDELTEEDKSAT